MRGVPRSRASVDITSTVEKKIEANLCNVAKGPGGHHGSQLRARTRKQGKKLPLLGDDDRTADRNYIREFVLAPIASWARSTESSMRRHSTTSARTQPPSALLLRSKNIYGRTRFHVSGRVGSPSAQTRA